MARLRPGMLLHGFSFVEEVYQPPAFKTQTASSISNSASASPDKAGAAVVCGSCSGEPLQQVGVVASDDGDAISHICGRPQRRRPGAPIHDGALTTMIFSLKWCQIVQDVRRSRSSSAEFVDLAEPQPLNIKTVTCAFLRIVFSSHVLVHKYKVRNACQSYRYHS